MKTKQNQFIIQTHKCTHAHTKYTILYSCMFRCLIINCTRCTEHISKQKKLALHGNYSKTVICLKKNYRDILWIFRIVRGMFRHSAESSFFRNTALERRPNCRHSKTHHHQCGWVGVQDNVKYSDQSSSYPQPKYHYSATHFVYPGL